MTKRRNRWSQEEGDGLIEEVDNRVFEAAGSLTVHRFVSCASRMVTACANKQEAIPHVSLSFLHFVAASFTGKDLLQATMPNTTMGCQCALPAASRASTSA